MVYVSPLLIWLGMGALAATELGSYAHSWDLMHWLIDKIEPGFYYPDPQIISMYQVTQMTRKIAHIVLYSGLTALLVRLFQAGNPHLRFRSLLYSTLVSGAFMGVESYIRLNQSEGQRHVRVQQFILNGVGVGGALLLIVLYFGLKALERWLLTESRLPRSSPRDRVPPGCGSAKG